MRLAGSGLRAIVVTLDPGRSEARAESPATLLKALGHEVTTIGYDLAELETRPVAADVAIVEAGEHLEIGRHAIKRLRQRTDMVATRILLCLDVARVSGLDPEMGADDFILIPISSDELAARIRQLQARDKRPGAPLQIRYGHVVLDCEMRQAYEGGKSLGLTPYEFQLLRFLADRVGRVFTRQELLSRVWGYRHVGRVRTVDTHVLNLRSKLGVLGERLQSVRGMGYKLQRADAPADGPAANVG
jgi:two-component system OmpR family response regulator/two-component system alkaline phosphatase synthesis response regulator PhoP